MSPRRRVVVLVLLFAAGILNYMDRQIIAVLKPLLQSTLAWTDAEYGLLTSAFQFAAAAAYLATGWIVDRLGWRWANPLGVGAWSLAAMSHAFARTIGQFTVARLALGATESLGTPAGVKTVAVLFPAEERSFALGLQNAAGNIGAILTPLFIPAFALAYGWDASFLLVGGLGLVWVAAWLAFMHKTAPGAPATGAPVTDAPITGAPVTDAPAPPVRVGWRALLIDRRTWAIAGAKALFDAVWWFLLFWMPDLFHRQFHLDMRDFGPPLAVVYAMAATGSILGGFLSGRLMAAGFSVNAARKGTLLICALLVTPVPLVLLVDDHWIAVAILGLALAAHQGFSVNVFALAADVVPQDRVARVVAMGALAGNLAGMAILQLAGWWIGMGAGYGPFLFYGAIAYLAALAWIHAMLPRLAPVA